MVLAIAMNLKVLGVALSAAVYSHFSRKLFILFGFLHFKKSFSPTLFVHGRLFRCSPIFSCIFLISLCGGVKLTIKSPASGTVLISSE